MMKFPQFTAWTKWKSFVKWLAAFCIVQLPLLYTATSQTHIYSETFTLNVTPSTQCTAWNAFKASLTPGVYSSVTIRGTNDPVGITCYDEAIANALADAMLNDNSYLSPLTNGHTWAYCPSHSTGELWLDPPSLCSGSNCPSPGYILRPCITNANWGGINTLTCRGNPTQVMELIFEGSYGMNNAGIASIDSPLNFCPGSYPVIITLQNNGENQITSATIDWELNGVAQPTINWTGLLDTTTVTARTTSVTLTNSYNFLAGVPYTIKAWVSNPNGQVDTVTSNDMKQVTRKSALAGTFTIGNVGADYSNFSDAVTDIADNGLCGPVVFKVQNGTYNEQISIGEISGSSSVNTVTFESASGNRADVTLTNSGYVLQYNGCDYVTFQNMTITTTSGRAIEVQSGSDYCTLENLDVNGANDAVIYSTSSTNNHYMTIRGCNVYGGTYGMYWYGVGTSALDEGLIIENNMLTGFTSYGIRLYYLDAPLINANTLIATNTHTGSYIMYCRYLDNRLRFTNNKLTASGYSGTKYGLRLYYADASPGSEGLIANNFFNLLNGSGTAYGIQLYSCTNQKFYFNTVHTNSTSSSSMCLYTYSGSNLDCQNNILYNAGTGYAFYTNSTSNVIASDYNVFYTGGTNIGYWNGTRATLNDWRAASGLDANTVAKVVSFADINTGDLHLSGASEDDDDLIGLMLPDVSTDIDNETRILPYRGADEACYITAGTVKYDLVDANGTQIAYANVPGDIGVHYYVAFPEFDANITITLNFYSVPGNTLVYNTSFNVQKAYGQILDGIKIVPLNNIADGIYRIEAVFHTKNSCGGYRDYLASDMAFMLLPQGTTPCVVWPGDVNNDGLVNYGDRKSLNTYIRDANLQATWLTGPSRYRADAADDPLTYIRWEPQAAVPWATPEGCYMDADGNGIVNSFDYIPIKLNWMRNRTFAAPKNSDSFSSETFDMSQNFPNPFNPSTQIRFSTPEQSAVKIVVTNLLGEEIETLVDDVFNAGVHTITFNAQRLGGGSYIAVSSMQGLESGITFTKTIRMTLLK